MVEKFEEVSAPAWAEKAWSGNQNTNITLEMADARMETPYAPGEWFVCLCNPDFSLRKPLGPYPTHEKATIMVKRIKSPNTSPINDDESWM